MKGSEDNLEFDFAVAPIDESHFKAPLGKQLGDFREFGTQTRLVQTQAQLFTGQSITAIVVATVMRLVTTFPSVPVIADCAPMTSLFSRLISAPVCVRVKNATGIR